MGTIETMERAWSDAETKQRRASVVTNESWRESLEGMRSYIRRILDSSDYAFHMDLREEIDYLATLRAPAAVSQDLDKMRQIVNIIAYTGRTGKYAASADRAATELDALVVGLLSTG